MLTCPLCKQPLKLIQDLLGYLLDICSECKYYSYYEKSPQDKEKRKIDRIVIGKYILHIDNKFKSIRMGTYINECVDFWDLASHNNKVIKFFDIEKETIETLKNKIEIYELFE